MVGDPADALGPGGGVVDVQRVGAGVAPDVEEGQDAVEVAADAVAGGADPDRVVAGAEVDVGRAGDRPRRTTLSLPAPVFSVMGRAGPPWVLSIDEGVARLPRSMTQGLEVEVADAAATVPRPMRRMSVSGRCCRWCRRSRRTTGSHVPRHRSISSAAAIDVETTAGVGDAGDGPPVDLGVARRRRGCRRRPGRHPRRCRGCGATRISRTSTRSPPPKVATSTRSRPAWSITVDSVALSGAHSVEVMRSTSGVAADPDVLAEVGALRRPAGRCRRPR